MTNRSQREYSIPGLPGLNQGWLADSLLVRDAADERFTAQRLRQHLAAVHARLIDRTGDLVAREAAPGRREERELRFMLDELIEALHRLDAPGAERGVVS